MGIFDEGKNLEQDAEHLAREHPQQAERVISDAEGVANRDTDGRFSPQIQEAGQRADEYLGGGANAANSTPDQQQAGQQQGNWQDPNQQQGNWQDPNR